MSDAHRRGRTVRLAVGAAVMLGLCVVSFAEKPVWRQATESELAAQLPARAPVEREHIETELRTATGITDGKGHFIAGIVLITAGYSAEGKYSHYLLVQEPLKIGNVSLAAGEYVLGFERDHDGKSLKVHFNEAPTGKLVGMAEAHELTGKVGVASLRIWPPSEKPIFQIGRFGISYELTEP